MKTYYYDVLCSMNQSAVKFFLRRLHDSLLVLLPIRGASIIIAGVDEILDSIMYIFFGHFGLSVNGDFQALRRIRSCHYCWLVCYSRAFCLVLAASDAHRLYPLLKVT